MESPSPRISLFELAEFLALWNGLYVASAYVCLSSLLGREPRMTAIIAIATLAMGTYLIDRVKLSRAMLDPADRATHPRRAGFIERHAMPVRALSIGCGLVAAILLWLVHPLASLLVPLSYGGAMFYARPRRYAWRPKDIFVVKNMCVAGAIVAMCLAVVMLEERHTDSIAAFLSGHWVGLVIAGTFVGLHVFADAAACDIDDRIGDGQFGTHTFPVVTGLRSTFRLILMINGVALVVAVAGGFMQDLAMPAALLWAFMIPAGTVMCLQISPLRPRVAIDIRFTVITIFVLSLSASMPPIQP